MAVARARWPRRSDKTEGRRGAAPAGPTERGARSLLQHHAHCSQRELRVVYLLLYVLVTAVRRRWGWGGWGGGQLRKTLVIVGGGALPAGRVQRRVLVAVEEAYRKAWSFGDQSTLHSCAQYSTGHTRQCLGRPTASPTTPIFAPSVRKRALYPVPTVQARRSHRFWFTTCPGTLPWHVVAEMTSCDALSASACRGRRRRRRCRPHRPVPCFMMKTAATGAAAAAP